MKNRPDNLSKKQMNIKTNTNKDLIYKINIK
jgi:hypothetical protein